MLETRETWNPGPLENGKSCLPPARHAIGMTRSRRKEKLNSEEKIGSSKSGAKQI